MKQKFDVTGMSCAACSAAVERAVNKLEGVDSAQVNLLANSIVSFSCAMQVQAFRKVNGYAFASTMCIGNLRSGMDSLCAWLVGGNAKAFGKAVHYFAIIFLFALGAGIGSVALLPMAGRAIWLSCLLLGVSFCLMFLKEDIEELEQLEQMEAHKK